MQKTKIRLFITTLIMTLSLSGCSFNLIHKSNKEGKIVTNNKHSYSFNNDNDIDKSLDIEKEKKYKIDYNYLIDKSEYTRATLAHVIDEKTITSESKLFDNKKEMSTNTFNDEVIQPIIIPQIFKLYNIEKMSDLIGKYGECEVNCKKMYTIDGDILYYLDSTFTFNNFAEKFLGFDIKENDTLNAKVVFKYNDDNTGTILYRNQTGIESIISNVRDMNFNNEKEIVIPIKDTVFNQLNGEYSDDYLLEALDTYNDTDNFYSKENEGKDFSSFQKK